MAVTDWPWHQAVRHWPFPWTSSSPGLRPTLCSRAARELICNAPGEVNLGKRTRPPEDKERFPLQRRKFVISAREGGKPKWWNPKSTMIFRKMSRNSLMLLVALYTAQKHTHSSALGLCRPCQVSVLVPSVPSSHSREWALPHAAVAPSCT